MNFKCCMTPLNVPLTLHVKEEEYSLGISKASIEGLELS